jgi:hypothetical protein
MVQDAGHLHEAVCCGCQSRFFAQDATLDLCARFLKVDPSTIRQATQHFGGRHITCPGCLRRMSQVPLRGALLDVCTGCGGMFMDKGLLTRITDGGVEETASPPMPVVDQPLPNINDLPNHSGRYLAYLPAVLGVALGAHVVTLLLTTVMTPLLRPLLGAEAATTWARVLPSALEGLWAAPAMVWVGAAVAPAFRMELTQLAFALTSMFVASSLWNVPVHLGRPAWLIAVGNVLGGALALMVFRLLKTAFSASREDPPPLPLGSLKARFLWLAKRASVMMLVAGAVGAGILGIDARVDRKARGICPEGTRQMRQQLAEGISQTWCESLGAGLRTGPFVESFASGRPREEGTFARGLKEGTWRGFHANGQPRFKGDHQADRRTGVWTSWFDNGQVEQQGPFENGQPHGHWVDYHASGGRKMEGDFRAGLRHGAWVWYAADGRVEERGAYVLGKEDGVWTSYPAGSAPTTRTYAQGVLRPTPTP